LFTKENEHISGVPYASVVGSIMYVTIFTHLDISYGISVVIKFMRNPGKVHLQVMKWIFYYFKSTINIGLIYNRASRTKSSFEGFVNSNYAFNWDRQRSLKSYVFIFSRCVIGWIFFTFHYCLVYRKKVKYMELIEVMKKIDRGKSPLLF